MIAKNAIQRAGACFAPAFRSKCGGMRWEVTQVLMIFGLLFFAGSAALPIDGNQPSAYSVPDTGNWRPDGTYLLKTDDRSSFKNLYRDLGIGELVLPSWNWIEAMMETCQTLGSSWSPLGIMRLGHGNSGPKGSLDMCFNTAPVSGEAAGITCGYLGLRLNEYRPNRREIFCTAGSPTG